ncbi:MAG: xanthine dehydrogenase family protein subunit [Polaromonas sp.]|nr:xanthine dehydrogenase family protein subunit [Polaromonas sp.]
MREFEYLSPTSVAEASRMLADAGEDCRVMAGGTALLLAMRQRMATPSHVVSLAGLDRLRGIDFDGTAGLRIGALARHSDVERSPLVQQHYPMLASMAARVANPQVRNQGTLGGNLCYADPATDPPGCLLALGASVVLGSARGDRVLPMADFLVDYYTTALEPDEVLVEIRVPVPAAGSDGIYSRFRRTAAEHRPLVNLSLMTRRRGQVCEQATLVVGASTVIPTRARRAEDYLAGKPVTLELADEAAALVAADIEPLSDQRGSADYRRDMVRVVARRSIAGLFGLATE